MAMAGSIKLFGTVQNAYKILGLRPPQTNQTLAFNSRNLFFLLCFIQSAISIGAFFIFQARTMQAYGSSFFQFLTQLHIAVEVLILMWHIANILEFIASLEAFIAKRKQNVHLVNFLINKRIFDI